LVSKGYEVLQNAEAFDIFRPLVEDGVISLETAGSLKNGRVVWILAKINAVSEREVAKGDVVKPYVLLSNSHDTTLCTRLGFTGVRVVCNNTLSLAFTRSDSNLVRLYHRSGLRDGLIALRETMKMGISAFEATADQYAILAKTPINQEDLVEYVREVIQKTEETPTERKIIQTLHFGRGGVVNKDERTTWWDAYNAINEYMLYQRGANPDNRLKSAWFGDGYLIDQRAFDIAWKRAA